MAQQPELTPIKDTAIGRRLCAKALKVTILDRKFYAQWQDFAAPVIVS